MKRIISLIFALAALALAPLLTAQNTAYYQLTSITTGLGMDASATLTITNQVLDVRNWQNVGLYLTFAGTDVDTGDLTLSISKSLDGTYYETTPGITWAVASNGTNTVRAVTNIDIGMVGYIKFVSLANAATNAITNVAVKYNLKLPRVTRRD